MRRRALPSALLAATAVVVVGALVPCAAPAQQPKSQQQGQQPKSSAPPQAQQPPQQQPGQPTAPKPYKPVAVQLPQPVKDASFEAFRKQLAGIAQKKDRAALARVMAQNFFWIPEDKDVADKRKPAIDNLAKAIGLDGRDPPGWDLLAGYAEEASADPDPQRKGVICGPA